MGWGTRAVPRIFCLRGQTPHTFTGVSRMQTGFLVGRFVFTPTQNVASKTFKETNHTDAFCFNCHDLYTIFNSSYTVNSSFTLCMDGSKNRLKAFVSLKSLY